MEQEQFLRLAKVYKDMIYRVALNLTGSPYDADDVVQEVLLKLYTAKQEFTDESHTKYWLIRVTVNQCKSLLRKPWRRNLAIEDFDLPFEHPEQSELFYQVMRLPDRYRIVLYLFYYEEYSVRDIAGLLHINASAVTTRLSRARKKLKVELTEAMQHEI